MSLQIRSMTASDISVGMRLKSQARWNQVEADWLRFLALEPDGCFVGWWDGQPVATATAFIFGQVSWIAMLLVDETMRGRGVGTAMMNHTLGWLDQRGVASVRLDATPAGRPIYEKLGFVAQYDLQRVEGTLPTHVDHRTDSDAGVQVRPMREDDLQQVAQLDEQATRAQRADLLEAMFRETQGQQLPLALVATREGELAGYSLWRPGSNATQIGPTVARDPQAGLRLLEQAASTLAGQRVFVDVPESNPQAIALLQQLGLTVQRPFTRMCRGRQVNDEAAWIFASSGPEKG